MGDKITLTDLKVGETLRGELAVMEAQLKSAANGPYVMLTLTDGERDIVGKRWKYDQLPEVGGVLQIVAEVGEYQGKKDLNIKRWIPGELPASEFARKGPTDTAFVYDVLLREISFIENADLRYALLDIYGTHVDKIKSSPGALKVHHNYTGGFLQHTFEVINNAIVLANSMNEASGMQFDYDVLRAGALLHDIGKLCTYEMDGVAIRMSDVGQFLEHILVGSNIVFEHLMKHNVDRLIGYKVLHCIGAHHGELEYGSPVKPVTLEAMLIHFADQVSAKCTIVVDSLKSCDTTWTDKNYYLGVRLYNERNNQ